MKLKFGLVITLAFFSISALADSSIPVACLRKPSTDVVVDCLTQRLEAEDNLLNRVYQELVSELKDNATERVTPLIQAERSWITYRDNQCKFDASVSTPSDLSGVAETLCKINETQTRRIRLEQMLKQSITGESLP